MPSLVSPSTASLCTLNVAYLHHLLAHLGRVGIDPSALYGAPAVERIHRLRAGARVPVSEWDEMMCEAERKTGDACLPLRVTEALKPWDTGAIGFVSMSSENLSQAFSTLAPCSSLLNDAYKLEGQLDAERFCIRMRPVCSEAYPRLGLYTLSILCGHARLLVGRPDLAFDAELIEPPPVSEAVLMAYRKAFGGRLAFGAEAYAIMGPAHYAQARVAARHDNGVSEALRGHLEARMAMLNDDGQRVVRDLEQAIVARLATGQVDLDGVAQVLGLSSRTLQSRLAERGLSYRIVLDRVRYQHAMRLVRDTRIPLLHVALMLGFNSPSSFHHAFRRWTQLAPRDYRRSKAAQVVPPQA